MCNRGIKELNVGGRKLKTRSHCHHLLPPEEESLITLGKQGKKWLRERGREVGVGWNNINEKKITNIRHDLEERWCNMYKGIRCNKERQIRLESLNIYWMRLSFCWLGENLLYPPPTWPLRFFTYLSPILREQFSI